MTHEIELRDSDETESLLKFDTCGTDQVRVSALREDEEIVVYLSRIQAAALAAWLTAALLETKEAKT